MAHPAPETGKAASAISSGYPDIEPLFVKGFKFSIPAKTAGLPLETPWSAAHLVNNQYLIFSYKDKGAEAGFYYMDFGVSDAGQVAAGLERVLNTPQLSQNYFARRILLALKDEPVDFRSIFATLDEMQAILFNAQKTKKENNPCFGEAKALFKALRDQAEFAVFQAKGIRLGDTLLHIPAIHTSVVAGKSAIESLGKAAAKMQKKESLCLDNFREMFMNGFMKLFHQFIAVPKMLLLETDSPHPPGLFFLSSQWMQGFTPGNGHTIRSGSSAMTQVYVDDPAARIAMSQSPPGLGLMLAFCLGLQDRDFQGPHMDNIGVCHGLPSKLDLGHALEEGSHTQVLTLTRDLNVHKLLGLAENYQFRNIGVYADTPIEERMLGFHLFLRAMGHIGYLAAIKPENLGPEWQQRLEQIEANSFDRFMRQQSQEIMAYCKKNGLDPKPFLDEIDRCGKMMKQNAEIMWKNLQPRLLYTPEHLRLVDNLEKIAAASTILSENRQIILQHPRLKDPSERVEINLSPEEGGYLLQIIARNRKELEQAFQQIRAVDPRWPLLSNVSSGDERSVAFKISVDDLKVLMANFSSLKVGQQYNAEREQALRPPPRERAMTFDSTGSAGKDWGMVARREPNESKTAIEAPNPQLSLDPLEGFIAKLHYLLSSLARYKAHAKFGSTIDEMITTISASLADTMKLKDIDSLLPILKAQVNEAIRVYLDKTGMTIHEFMKVACQPDQFIPATLKCLHAEISLFRQERLQKAHEPEVAAAESAHEPGAAQTADLSTDLTHVRPQAS